MVVCVVPTNRKDRYDAIKKFCCVDHAVPSQVVVTKTISKQQMVMSVCTKIAIQLNCKLGGEVWAVEIPVSNTPVSSSLIRIFSGLRSLIGTGCDLNMTCMPESL